ncbi:hypothetical protein WJX84_007810 [Apatococcus fuscideae]|uniref:Uncharacterized protein n=1 Tax=Apatococcus fuscideae TaxID=2026836 RepID=A0AAW1RRE9_9CHLO
MLMASCLAHPPGSGMCPVNSSSSGTSTGSLWQKGSLYGKPFGRFVSTASQGGGQEVTISSGLSNFVHHGMIFVPVGSTYGPALFDVETLRGGSAWGAGTYAGATGARMPTALELDVAEHQGREFAKVAKRLKVTS